jgi:hypothetical protein
VNLNQVTLPANDMGTSTDFHRSMAVLTLLVGFTIGAVAGTSYWYL